MRDSASNTATIFLTNLQVGLQNLQVGTTRNGTAATEFDSVARVIDPMADIGARSAAELNEGV